MIWAEVLSLCALVFVVVGAAVGAETHAHQMGSAADILKAFLASPHDTGDIIYTWRFARPVAIPGTTIRLPDAPVVFKAKWQPGASFVIQFSSTNALRSAAKDQLVFAAGKTAGKAWVYGNGYLQRFDGELNAAAAQSLSNQVQSCNGQLFSALGFGIPYQPGTLRWQGNRFTAIGFDGREFEGEMLVADDGTPNELVVPPLSTAAPSIRLRLHYSPDTVDALPAGYDYVETQPDGQVRPGVEVHIVSLSWASEALPPSVFTPETVLGPLLQEPSAGRGSNGAPWVTVVHSNRQGFYLRSNRMVLLSGVPTRPRHGRAVVWVAFLGASLAITVFFLRTRREQTKQRRT